MSAFLTVSLSWLRVKDYYGGADIPVCQLADRNVCPTAVNFPCHSSSADGSGHDRFPLCAVVGGDIDADRIRETRIGDARLAGVDGDVARMPAGVAGFLPGLAAVVRHQHV